MTMIEEMSYASADAAKFLNKSFFRTDICIFFSFFFMSTIMYFFCCKRINATFHFGSLNAINEQDSCYAFLYVYTVRIRHLNKFLSWDVTGNLTGSNSP